MLENPNDIRYCLEKALLLSKKGRMGPCWIDIPVNFQGTYIETENLKLNIDERFNERKVGEYNKEEYPNFFCDQYWNKEFKSKNGESQIEVNKRMLDGFWDVVNKNKGKNIAIISHGTAITFLLMNWCKLLDVQANFLRKIEFDGKIIINRIYNAPEVFKITLNEQNSIVNIENLEYKY